MLEHNSRRPTADISTCPDLQNPFAGQQQTISSSELFTSIVSKLQPTVCSCVTAPPNPFFFAVFFLGRAPVAEDDSPRCDTHCLSFLKAPPPQGCTRRLKCAAHQPLLARRTSILIGPRRAARCGACERPSVARRVSAPTRR